MKILIAMMSALMLTSCAIDQCGPTKEKFLSNYENFVDKVESKDLASDKEEWKSIDQKFDKYLSECFEEFKGELTNSETIDFASTTVRYYYNRYGKEITEQFGDSSEEFARELSSQVKEFLDGHDEEIEQMVEEMIENFDRQDFEDLVKKGSEFLETLSEEFNK